MPQQTKEEAVTEENVSGWIPLVNDKAVDAEDIYVDNGGGGSNSLLISSVNVKNPELQYSRDSRSELEQDGFWDWVI